MSQDYAHRREASDNLNCPRYVGLSGDDFIEVDNDLPTLLDILRGIDVEGDVVVWHENRALVAVLHGAGTCRVFVPQGPEKPLSPRGLPFPPSFSILHRAYTKAP